MIAVLAVASAADPAPFAPLWSVETGAWNAGLSFAPSGDLVAIDRRRLAVLARDDGRVLTTALVCPPVTEDGLGWVDGALVVACADQLVRVTWPGLEVSTVVRFPHRVERAAVGAGRVAVGEDGFGLQPTQPVVRLYDAATGAVIDEFAPGGESQALALSPDGATIAVAAEPAGLKLRAPATHTTTATWPLEGAALRFSPDGKVLFGVHASFVAAQLEVATGAETGRWKVGSWVTAARWLDDAQVVATGSDGLAWFAPGVPTRKEASVQTGEGLAVSDDAGTVCAGDREGRVACFSRTAVAPSTFVPVPAPAAPVPAAAPAAGELHIGSVSVGQSGDHKTLDVDVIQVDGPELRDLHCDGVAGGILGPMVLGQGLASRRDTLQACAPGGAAVSLTWTWSGGAPTAVTVAASSETGANACVQKGFRGLPGQAQWNASCRAWLLVGDLGVARAAFSARKP